MTETSKESVSVRPVRRVRKFTAEQRRAIVAESCVAGASVSEVAARYGLRANQLSAWRSRSKAGGAPSRGGRFAAVRISPPVSDGVIEMDISSGCIRVRGEVSIAMLREAVGLMR
jgi:transposase